MERTVEKGGLVMGGRCLGGHLRRMGGNVTDGPTWENAVVTGECAG